MEENVNAYCIFTRYSRPPYYVPMMRNKMKFWEMKIIKIFVIICGIILIEVLFRQYFKLDQKRKSIFIPKFSSSIKELKVKENMELVVRLTLTEFFINRLYCDILRSSSVFWNSTLLGDFFLILDEKDRKYAPKFIKDLESIPNMPHSFRVYYEKLPVNIKPYKKFTKSIGRPIGYGYQLLSMFLMDLYTDKEILAYIDTDTAFIAPVLKENVMNSKGQLIVKGWNSLDWPQNQGWRRATEAALGVPMVSDFMTYFPMFLHRKTIKNCREYIIKRLNVSSFEEAFVLLINKDFVSSCNVLMTYAYYFEYDSYEWHIDIRHEQLEVYNKKYCPSKPLSKKDITPAIHLASHSTYSISPLERALCNMYYYSKMKLSTKCSEIFQKNKLQLFEFEKRVTHFDTWCKPGNFNCKLLVDKQYTRYREEINAGKMHYNTNIIRDIEKSFKEIFKKECSKISF